MLLDACLERVRTEGLLDVDGGAAGLLSVDVGRGGGRCAGEVMGRERERGSCKRRRKWEERGQQGGVQKPEGYPAYRVYCTRQEDRVAEGGKRQRERIPR